MTNDAAAIFTKGAVSILLRLKRKTRVRMNIELQLDSVFIAGAWAQFGHGRLFLCGGYLLCKSHVCKRTVIGPLVHTNSKFEGPEADCHLR